MYIIDRFEGDWAIVEYNRKTFNLPRTLAPPEAVEGDVILIKVSVDVKATARLKGGVRDLANELFKEEKIKFKG